MSWRATRGPHPEAAKKGRQGRRRRLQGARGRGTLEKEKPPIFGRLQLGGEVVVRMLENVQQPTMKPLILGTIVYTDEYDLYAHLPEWGDGHKTV